MVLISVDIMVCLFVLPYCIFVNRDVSSHFSFVVNLVTAG